MKLLRDKTLPIIPICRYSSNEHLKTACKYALLSNQDPFLCCDYFIVKRRYLKPKHIFGNRIKNAV